MMHDITIIIVMALTILGPSAVIAAVSYSSIYALGRNPSSAPKIMLAMIVALIFTGGLNVITLLVFFHLFAK
ncbi:MAG: hypothetical protein WC551_12495 [Patescibacteria group bacterium]